MEGAGRKESIEESAEWSGADSKGSAMEEEEDTAGEDWGGGSGTQMEMTWGIHNSGTGELPGDTAAGGSETGKATSAAADKPGSGGGHGAKSGVTKRVAGQQENPLVESYGVGGEGEGNKAYGVASKPSGVGGDGGGHEAYGVAENPGGGAREWEGGLSSLRASTPPE